MTSQTSRPLLPRLGLDYSNYRNCFPIIRRPVKKLNTSVRLWRWWPQCYGRWVPSVDANRHAHHTRLFVGTKHRLGRKLAPCLSLPILVVTKLCPWNRPLPTHPPCTSVSGQVRSGSFTPEQRVAAYNLPRYLLLRPPSGHRSGRRQVRHGRIGPGSGHYFTLNVWIMTQHTFEFPHERSEVCCDVARTFTWR